MSVQLTATQLLVIEKTPLEVALDVNGIGKRALVQIIVEYCAPRFQEIATAATAWLTGKLPLRNENAFHEILLQFSVPFAKWLVSKREGDQTSQLQLCEGLFQRIAAQNVLIHKVSQLVFAVMGHFKARLDTPVSSALAFDLRVILHQLFVLKQTLVFFENDSQETNKMCALYKLQPPEVQKFCYQNADPGAEIQVILDSFVLYIEGANFDGGPAELKGLIFKFVHATMALQKACILLPRIVDEKAIRVVDVLTQNPEWFPKIINKFEQAGAALCQRIEAEVNALDSEEGLASLKGIWEVIKNQQVMLLVYKAALASRVGNDISIRFKLQHFVTLLREPHPLLNTFYPEFTLLRDTAIFYARKDLPNFDVARMEEILTKAERESNLYKVFQIHVSKIHLGYAFLHTMHQNLVVTFQDADKLAYEKLLLAGPQASLLTPEAFSQLNAKPRSSAQEAQVEWDELVKKFEGRFFKRRSAEASFAPSIKKPRPVLLKKPKHKKDLQLSVVDPKKEGESAAHGAAAAAGAGAGKALIDLEALKRQGIDAKKEGESAAHGAAAAARAGVVAAQAPLQGLEAIFAQRSVDLKTFKVAPRVQARLDAPKTKGAQREDTWAHGFTTQLDQFLGTSYCYSIERPHPQTNQKETHHCFIVMAEDEEGPILEATGGPANVLYLATYTVDKNGVCYHRCLQRKSLFELVNATAKGQVLNLVEWPSLEQAAEKAKPRVEEQNNRPMQHSPVSGIVTVFDKKHNVTFKVLPRD